MLGMNMNNLDSNIRHENVGSHCIFRYQVGVSIFHIPPKINRNNAARDILKVLV